MARVTRAHFVAAIDAGLAACPILAQNSTFEYQMTTLKTYAASTLVGRFEYGDCECPLSAAGVVEVDYEESALRLTRRAQRILGDTPVSTADFDPFWQAFDAYLRPLVTSWDGDSKTPIAITDGRS